MNGLLLSCGIILGLQLSPVMAELASASTCFSGVALGVEGLDTKNVGVFNDNETPSADFTVVNRGNVPVRIVNILKTCGCNSVAISRKELKPDEKTVISVRVEPYTLDGPFSKSVFVVTEPAQGKHLSLTVTGESMPLFKVRPAKQINAGKLKNGDAWKGLFEIASNSSATFGTVVVTSDCPATVELKQTEECSWKLPVELIAPTNGSFKCEITLPVIKPEGRPPMVFHVFGRAGSELIAVPRTLIVPKGEACIKTVQLRVIGERGRKLKPDDLTVTPEIEGLSFKAESERNGDLSLTILISEKASSSFNDNGYCELHLSVPGVASTTILLEMSARDS